MDVYRHLLRFYPKSFRHDYGDAMRQAHNDLRVHGGLRGPRMLFETTRDVVRSAPRLRLEAAMSTHPARTRATLTILIAAAFVALAAMGPLLGIPLLLAFLLYARRHAHDLATAGQSSSMWIGMPIVGGVLLLLGFVAHWLGADDNGWWPLTVGPALIGCTLLVVTLVLGGCHAVAVRFGRPELAPARVRATSAGIAIGALVIGLVAMGEDRGWAMFMITVLSLITLGMLGLYGALLHFTRPRRAPAV